MADPRPDPQPAHPAGGSVPYIAPEVLIDGPARAARATLRDDIVAEYFEALHGGAVLPPPTVFTDGASWWLADGRHRLEAHRKAFPGEPIEVQVLEGGELDALRHALRANTDHGLRRSPGDLQAAYRAAVAAGLAEPGDAGVVQEVLGCSRRSAFRLTEAARTTDRERREEMIAGLRSAGASQREVAAAAGVDERTVRRAERQPDKSANGTLVRSEGSGRHAQAQDWRSRRSPPRPPPPSASHGTPTALADLTRAAAELRDVDPVALAADLPADVLDAVSVHLRRLQVFLAAFLTDVDGRRGKQPEWRL